MAKNNRGPIGVGNNIPQIDLQTLSLVENAPRNTVGMSELSVELLLSSKVIASPVFIDEKSGFAVTIYFDINSFLPHFENYQAILRLKKYIQQHNYEIMHISIEGHASSTGNVKYNFDLSKKRNEFVYNLLMLNDKDFAVEKKYYGESKLAMAENGKGEILEYQRSKNRRVEIYGYKQLPTSKEKKIDLFPKEVIRKYSDTDLMQYMLKLPNLQAEKPKIILEEYVKRIFDKIYDPTLGRLEKPLMDSKVGGVLKFFGVTELKEPIRDAVVDKLYDLVDQTNVDPNAKKMLKDTLKATMKQNFNR